MAVIERFASCSCGQLTAEVTSEPIRISMCHCLACQRRSGSTFAVQARFAADTVTIVGEWRTWTRTGDEGSVIDFHFCPACGSTVLYRQRDVPDVIAIAVGAFADPDFPAPTVSVYEARRHAWTGTPEDVTHLE